VSYNYNNINRKEMMPMRTMGAVIGVALWVGCFGVGESAAADPHGNLAQIEWKTLDSRDGLSDGFVHALAVDEAHVYIGTNAGLNVFDKASRRVTVLSVPQGLPGPRVLSLLPDGEQVWIGTDKGLAVLRSGKLVGVPGEGPASSKRVNSMAKNGAALLLGTNDGVFTYLPESGEVNPFAGLEGKNVTSLRTDERGLLIGLIKGTIRIYDLKQDTFDEADRQLNPLDLNVSAIGTEGDSLWFATDGNGVIRYDKLTRRWERFGQDLPVDRFLAALAEDGNYLWFGTFYGLYRYAQKEDRWDDLASEVLTKDAISALAVDGSEIWVGTEGGGVVYGNKQIPSLRLDQPKRGYVNETAEFTGVVKGQEPLTVTLQYCNPTFPDLWFAQFATVSRAGNTFRGRLDLARLPDHVYKIRIRVADQEGRENQATFTLLKTTQPISLTFAEDPLHAGRNRVRGTITGQGIAGVVLKPGGVPAVIDPKAATFYAVLTLTAEDRQVEAEVWDIAGRSRRIVHPVQVAPLLELSITGAPDPFTPGSDEVQFELSSKHFTEVGRWELEITTDEEIPVMTFKGETPLPARLRWDGKDQYGDWADGGAKYLYRLSAWEKNGEGITTPSRTLLSKLVPKQRANQVVVRLSNSLLFDPGKADVKGDSNALFDELMEIIKQKPGVIILVEGHTDNTPIHTPKYPSNLQLSEARALNVADHLVKKYGLDPERISSYGYGEERPIEPNTSDAKRAKNRRVEIVLMRK
jgi:outer membrane protein OmpA-like peptidoglycan-associated protein